LYDESKKMPTVDYKIDNKKVPSVTTILGRFKNATGLLIWANQIGLKGQLYQDELKKLEILEQLYMI